MFCETIFQFRINCFYLVVGINDISEDINIFYKGVTAYKKAENKFLRYYYESGMYKAFDKPDPIKKMKDTLNDERELLTIYTTKPINLLRNDSEKYEKVILSFSLDKDTSNENPTKLIDTINDFRELSSKLDEIKYEIVRILNSNSTKEENNQHTKEQLEKLLLSFENTEYNSKIHIKDSDPKESYNYKLDEITLMSENANQVKEILEKVENQIPKITFIDEGIDG